jgi:hypothetical protein
MRAYERTADDFTAVLRGIAAAVRDHLDQEV